VRIRLAAAIGCLVMTGSAAGMASGVIEPAVSTGWRELPSRFDLAVSVALVAAAWAVFRVAPRRWRWLGLALSATASLRYLFWRATSTLTLADPADAIACVLLFAAECYTVSLLLLGHFQTYRPRRRSTPPVPPGARWPSVDVFITTYNESVDVVRRTAIGCRALRYRGEKRVWILDDGRRDAMRVLADELGIGYLTRADNAHAKAGNLNAALAHTDGELIAQFDADHVPVRSFLEETVPFLLDDVQLAFVQTPHHFHNPDVYQRNLLLGGSIANEQDLFFKVLQPGNDHWNAAFFCGSNAVLRRAAIADVGGFATETITEDAHTALRMHARGWRSAYYARTLAAGVTAETFADALKQRMRWGMGMIGILRVDNPLTIPGLKLAQRVCYFASSIFFFYGFPRILFVLAPALYALCGVRSIDASILPVAAVLLPHILCGWLVTSGVSRNHRHTWWSEVYESSMSVHMAVATTWALISRKRLPFKVTPKESLRERPRLSFRAALPQLVLLIVSVAGWLVAASSLPGASHEETGVLAMNLVWLSYNVLLLAAAVLAAVDRPQKRGLPRLPAHLPARVSWELDGRTIAVEGVAVDLSEGGAGILLRDPVPAGVPLRVSLAHEDERLELDARLVWCRGREEAGFYGCSLAFAAVGAAQRETLILWMFTDPDTWRRLPQPLAAGSAFARLAGTVLRWSKAREREELRTAPRMQLATRARLLLQGAPLDAEVMDLSQGGALVRVPRARLRRGDAVVVELTLADGRALPMLARVARRGRRGVIALRFEDVGPRKQADLLWELFARPTADAPPAAAPALTVIAMPRPA
jgi:cellulose synthase (UDP-forming)